MTYKIKPGDSLSKIADAHGLALAELLDANPRYKANPNRIRVGDELRMPHSEASPASGSGVRPSEPAATLGKLSEKYETGGRGPGTVSSGAGDAGGVSYGSYQMTSKNGGTVAGFVSQPDFPWRDQFRNLTPGSQAFTAKWKEFALNEPSRFQASQHDFIKKSHFDPLVARIEADGRLVITSRSLAVQDVIWSTAVQHGPNAPVVSRALDALKSGGALDLSDPDFDEKFIKAIYAERGKKDAEGNLVYFSRNSRAVQGGVKKRFVDEEKEALEMLRREA
jgi:hypothetical protein